MSDEKISSDDQMISTSRRQHEVVVARCGGRCEAEIFVAGVWTRCFGAPVEIHHLVTRGRGGDLLDEVGEDHHLGGLCTRHHRNAHSAGARGAGLLMDGYVTRDSATGHVYYNGPDPYLTIAYPDPRSTT